MRLKPMDYRHCSERLTVFERELRSHTDYAFVHREYGWRYTTFNPWGQWVTGLCELDGDVFKLDCSLAAGDDLGRDGLYAEWYIGMPPFLRLWAFTDDETIDRNVYEYWMTRFRDAILADPEIFGPTLGYGLTRIGVARANRG